MNGYFRFRKFTIRQNDSAFKVTTDSVLLGAWAELAEAHRLLDIGTGTGLLALMAAQRSHAQIVGVEPDKDSFTQALSNIYESPWASRITLVNKAIQDYSPGDGVLFDTIITNPPFFKDSLLNPDTRKAHTRHTLSLKSEEILEAAERLLTSEGTLQLVLPFNEAKEFIIVAGYYGFYCCRILMVRPKPLSPPKRTLLTLSHERHNPVEAELIIENDERHSYSDEYVALTKEFYLY